MRLSDALKRYEVGYVPVIIDQKRTLGILRQLMVLDQEVSEINYQTLLNYRATRKQAGYSEASVNKELAVLGSVLRWARETGLTSHAVKIPRVRETPRSESYTEEDIQRLIDAAPNFETKAFIVVLFATGQRFAAVQQLRKGQIVNGVIEFERDGYAKAARRKRRARTPVTKELLRIFKLLDEAFGANREFVFPGRHSRGYCQSLSRWFREASEACGIRAIPHGVRHSACSIAIDRGASLLEASRLLGHSNTQITERVYSHLKPSYIGETVSALGKLVRI